MHRVQSASESRGGQSAWLGVERLTHRLVGGCMTGVAERLSGQRVVPSLEEHAAGGTALAADSVCPQRVRSELSLSQGLGLQSLHSLIARFLCAQIVRFMYNRPTAHPVTQPETT